MIVLYLRLSYVEYLKGQCQVLDKCLYYRPEKMCTSRRRQSSCIAFQLVLLP